MAVIAVLGWQLAGSQSQAKSSLTQRLQQRVALGSEFASLYVADLLARESAQAQSWLSGPTVSRERFERTTSGLKLAAGVLVDALGRLLQVVPFKRALLGTAIADKYAHLGTAVAGREAVSNVVPSATKGLPVVALAVPFATSSGRRVFSGAYAVSKTPLGTYLNHLTVVPHHAVDLVDSSDHLIASSASGAQHGDTLAQTDSRLLDAARHALNGSYDAPGGRQYFVSSRIKGTPWRILMRVPAAQLFASVDGIGRWIGWVAVGGLALAGLAIILLIDRLIQGRRKLAVMNGELNRLAHVDPLTGISNRRAINRALEAALSASRRHGFKLSIMMIDIDHFKQINDTFGHDRGDVALCQVARLLQDGIRAEDVIGRWGGEEFLVTMPSTGLDGAIALAQRLRASVADSQPEHPPDSIVPVTITIGVTEWAGEQADDLIRAADRALYAGKLVGRNNVQPSGRPVAEPTPNEPEAQRSETSGPGREPALS
jgi:diguanylate cyclase (GGDEF)-like protein